MTAPAATEFKLADVAAPGSSGDSGNPQPDGQNPDALTTGVEHESEGHGAKPGLPQLDVSSFAGQLFWLVISFVALYLVISRIAVPKIGGVIADRQAKIKGDLDSAAEAKRASEAALANYEKALGDARNRALKLGDEMRNKVQAESNDKNEVAAKQLAADTLKAEAGIAEMRAGVMATLGTIARDTAAEIVQKLTGESAAAGDLDAAINSALKRN
jgi:F-type H+-transporting ATPase subunit b